jgi:hypothetical protein
MVISTKISFTTFYIELVFQANKFRQVLKADLVFLLSQDPPSGYILVQEFPTTSADIFDLQSENILRAV